VTEIPLNQALQSTLAVLTKVSPDDLAAPTPCASWDVRALVNHFTGTLRWWAATVAVTGVLAETEQFTHGWDLARAIGYPPELDPVLAERLLSQARLTITDALRGPDGQAMFGPAVAAPGGCETGRPARCLPRPGGLTCARHALPVDRGGTAAPRRFGVPSGFIPDDAGS
jgi:hypothetical protein